MKISCQLTQEDLVEFNVYHAEHSPLHIRTVRRQTYLGPLFFLGISAFGYFFIDHVFAGLFITTAILWVFLFPHTMKNKFRAQMVKHIEENFSQVDQEPTVVEIQEDGIHSSCYMGSAIYKYSSVEKIVEGDNVTYVYIGKGCAIVLPHDRIPAEVRIDFLNEIEKRTDLPGEAALNEKIK